LVFLFRDNFVGLFVTGILPTATMENNERLRIYRLLLLWNNKWKMVKFSLSGDEDGITIAARKIVDEVLSKEKDEEKMRYMYG